MAKVFKPFENNGVKDLTDKLMKRGQNATHGDLLIIRCEDSDLPNNFNSLPDAAEGVLAEGEHTAHAHQLFYDSAPNIPAFQPTVIDGGKLTNPATFVLKRDGTDLYMKIEGGPMLLKHQEHAPFRLSPGNYQIGIQQEYDPYERMKRAVLD